MQIYYSDVFVLPLPPEHRFPMSKYRLLRERVTAAGLVPEENVQTPEAATDEQLLLVHTAEYLNKLKHGKLTYQEVRRMGFPWSLGLVERSRRSVGGTISAARSALADGASVNMAGGTHHAHADWGQGFCVFNDTAIAMRTMQAEGRIKRGVIIDCDVHQGNGTAGVLEGDDSIFTFSIHGERNFPFKKATSDLDIGLENGTEDAAYLAALTSGLDHLFQHDFDLAIYIAGADPFIDDKLGKLSVSKAGLKKRDELVFDSCRRNGVPVAVCMGGGYAQDREAIVDIHFQTIQVTRQNCVK